jgi:hypothetical protein
VDSSRIAPTCAFLEWAKEGSICKLVVVIKEEETMDVVERWHFDIHTDDERGISMIENIPPSE